MPQLFGLARIGRDAEIRRLDNGDAVSNISLAFNYGKKAEDGKRPTQWAEGAIFGKRAEALAPYLLKGQQVAVTLDEVHIETFTSRDGTQGTKLVGKITQIDLAGKAPDQVAKPAPPPVAAKAAPTGFDDMDDDIPF